MISRILAIMPYIVESSLLSAIVNFHFCITVNQWSMEFGLFLDKVYLMCLASFIVKNPPPCSWQDLVSSKLNKCLLRLGSHHIRVLFGASVVSICLGNCKKYPDRSIANKKANVVCFGLLLFHFPFFYAFCAVHKRTVNCTFVSGTQGRVCCQNVSVKVA